MLWASVVKLDFGESMSIINSGNGITCKVANIKNNSQIEITVLNFFKPKKISSFFKNIQPNINIKIEICKRLQAQGLLEPKGNGDQNNVAKKKANKMECSEYFKVKKQLNFLMIFDDSTRLFYKKTRLFNTSLINTVIWSIATQGVKLFALT
jgi:hypothetical protein